MARRQVRHGSKSGYDKHRRVRKDPWGWPACGKCSAAHREYARELLREPGKRLVARHRAAARQAAFRRLQKLHQGEYSKLYAEELSILRDGGLQVITGLHAELARVLGSSTEAHLEGLVLAGTASLAERERYWQAQRVRGRIAEAQERAAAREGRDAQTGSEGQCTSGVPARRGP